MKLFTVMSTVFVLFTVHTLADSSSDSSDSSDSSEEESAAVTALKQQTIDFTDALAEWTIDGTTNLFEEGAEFSEDGIFCDDAVGCARSREEMITVFGAFSFLADIVFSNIKFTGVNPSLPIQSVTFIADEEISLFNGCKITIPDRVNVVYFDQSTGLVDQYHVIDTNEDVVLEFFTLLQATECT